MSRLIKKKDPAMEVEAQKEWKKQKMPLRIVGFVLALVLAATAFGSMVTEFFRTDSGWQVVTTGTTETGITQNFVLNYNAGVSGQSAKAELKAVSAIYSAALDAACKALSNEQYTGSNNLHALNAAPNQKMTVEPVLYDALRKLEEHGSRYAYAAPIRAQYSGIYHCATDEDAVLFDPARNPEIQEYVEKLAAFAADPDMISAELLPDYQVCLHVADAYLAFAQENEISCFLDFGLLQNAFLCDAAADALAAQGYTNGIVASFDGCTRAMSPELLGMNLFDLVDGKSEQVGIVTYSGPAAVYTCRSFPRVSGDQFQYYTYADGTIVSPYLGTDGMVHCAVPSLSVGREEGSVTDLAIAALDAYCAPTLDASRLTDFSWITTSNGTYDLHGSLFAAEQ